MRKLDSWWVIKLNGLTKMKLLTASDLHIGGKNNADTGGLNRAIEISKIN